MKWDKMNDPKYTRLFALLAGLFFLSGAVMGFFAMEKNREARELEEENERILAFGQMEPGKSSLPFYESLFRSESGEKLASAMEEAGVKVDRIREETAESDKGTFHNFLISGTGSYAQIVQTFDIIKGKERWTAVNLKELKRSAQGLAYEVEIQTFQIRGTYEKEKYSPHRSHGHRQEPGRQDPL